MTPTTGCDPGNRGEVTKMKRPFKANPPRRRMRMFASRRANMGASMLIGVILFNIIMYVFIYYANSDDSIDNVGSGNAQYETLNSTTDEDISASQMKGFFSGFNVSVFDMPWWVNIFYVTFQAVLFILAIYMLIRGI